MLVESGRVISPVRKVSFILQKDLLMPWRSVKDNGDRGADCDRGDSVRASGMAGRSCAALLFSARQHPQRVMAGWINKPWKLQ